MSENLLLILFNIFIVLMLILDLGFVQRRAHFPSMKEAIGWSVVWISLALLFDAYIWYELGSVKALEFFTGYVIEQALSVDNVFVFIVILTFHDHRHPDVVAGHQDSCQPDRPAPASTSASPRVRTAIH